MGIRPEDLTGVDYLIAAASHLKETDPDPYYDECLKVFGDIAMGAQHAMLSLDEPAGSQTKPHEHLTLAVAKTSVMTALQHGRQNVLPDLLPLLLGLIVKWERWIQRTVVELDEGIPPWDM